MIIKCKMCGGDIEFNAGETHGLCEYCGSTCTIPKVDEEQKLNRFNRANHFRRQGEFDKAMATYEKILEEDDYDAEAHWGTVLSRYGIEYVEDPDSKKRIPTCHRVQVESILADEDYQAALKYAPDTYSRDLYEQQAKEIAEIQKGILAISANEKPYDVFICYKESDADGKRTHDSALAQEVYYGLTEEGYKVFFSRITLEDKLGWEYEPYIFAALHSARVMVVVGTKPEYFNAVWVRNEWSRYLQLMKNDRKRLLIPCYRDMDPYDLPEELSNLQSQDMSRIGFMQDLIRGIRKVLSTEKEEAKVPKASVSQPAQSAGASPTAVGLLKRAAVFLEDGDWKSADEYADRVLDIDVETAQAHLYKLMAEYHVHNETELASGTRSLEKNANYRKALRYADPELLERLEKWNTAILDRIEFNRKAGILADFRGKLNSASTLEDVYALETDEGLQELEGFPGLPYFRKECDEKKEAINAHNYEIACQARDKRSWDHAIMGFTVLGSYRDSADQVEKCREMKNAESYRKAQALENSRKWDEAVSAYTALGDYQDSREKILACREAKEEEARRIREEQEQERIAAERKARAEKAKKRRIVLISTATIVLGVAAFLLTTKLIIPKGHYDKGTSLRTSGKWEEAAAEFKEAGEYRDAAEQVFATYYAEGQTKREAKDWGGAISAFNKASEYSDAAEQVLVTCYTAGIAQREAKNWDAAIASFRNAGEYSDAAEQMLATYYAEGIEKREAKDWDGAVTAFGNAGEYSDAAEQITETWYQKATDLTTSGKYDDAYAVFKTIRGYKDVDSLLKNNGNFLPIRKASFKTVGNIVTFGRYEQDNDAGNGPEAIEWIVLDVQEGKSLLLSKYGLDTKPYNTKNELTTWEKCSLRYWLNSDFLNSAFTAEEKMAVLTTWVNNDVDEGYSLWNAEGGSNTEDQIFLLSYSEANRYLNVTIDDINNLESRVVLTSYAIAQGAYKKSDTRTEEGTEVGKWWLRSPGTYQFYAAIVVTDGSLNFDLVYCGRFVVRPALWLNLESDIF